MKKISLFIEKLWVCAGIALYPAISLIWYRDYRVSRGDSRKFAGCFACGLGGIVTMILPLIMGSPFKGLAFVGFIIYAWGAMVQFNLIYLKNRSELGSGYSESRSNFFRGLIE